MIDFNQIKQTDNYNLHTHTQFCDGHAPMEEFVKSAVALGFDYLGFSPHSPLTFDTNCNMPLDSVADYFAEFDQLKALYGDKILLLKGMEVDYIDKWGPASEYFATLGLDYMIGSVHFLPSFDDASQYIDIDGSFERFKVKMHDFFHDDIVAVVKSFYEQSEKMIEKGGFDILGHLDKVGMNASLYQPGIDEEPWYDKLVKRVFDAVLDNHLTIEVNTKAWIKHQRFFPASKYFAVIKKYNIPYVVNSDAHYPELLNSGRAEAIKLLATTE